MNQRIYMANLPSNPFLQVLYFIVAGLVLIGAVLMGAVILAFVLGFVLVVGLFVWARVWWLQRKFRRGSPGGRQSGTANRPGGQGGGSAEIIEVEYTVVDERDDVRSARHDANHSTRRGDD